MAPSRLRQGKPSGITSLSPLTGAGAGGPARRLAGLDPLGLEHLCEELADLGFIADLTEQMGHPASAARAISLYIRFAQGDLDRVMTALDLISSEKLADDAGYPVVVAYWSEIVAGLRITDQCRRFISELEPLADAVQVLEGGEAGALQADRYFID